MGDDAFDHARARSVAKGYVRVSVPQARGLGKGGDGGKGGVEHEDADVDAAAVPAGWPAYSAVSISKTASSLQNELLHDRIINLCIERSEP